MRTKSLVLAALLTLGCITAAKELQAQDWLFGSPSPNLSSTCPTAAPFAIDPIGTIYDNLRPTFLWQSAPSAQSYTLYVQYADGGDTVLRRIGLPYAPTAYTPDQDLPLDVDLTWKVKGEATGCPAGPYSTKLPFRLENSEDTGGDPNAECPDLSCFPSLSACEDACTGGVCERRINCGGATAHKCFC